MDATWECGKVANYLTRVIAFVESQATAEGRGVDWHLEFTYIESPDVQPFDSEVIQVLERAYEAEEIGWDVGNRPRQAE